MSTGGEDIMKISAVRPLSVEAVEFSPAPVTGEDRRPGRKTMSCATGGSSPTKVIELPLSKAGGGGGSRRWRRFTGRPQRMTEECF